MKRYQNVLVDNGAPELPAGYLYDVYPLDRDILVAEVRKRVWWFFWREVGIAYGQDIHNVQQTATLCKAAYGDWQQRQGWRHRNSV